jgi:flagellar L-ring protein precursor FlgH
MNSHPQKIREVVMSLRSRISTLTAAALAASALGGCAYLDRLATVGEAPRLGAVDNPTAAKGYKPVNMPMPEPMPATFNPNSLWRNGSRAFFKDQRAHQVGDILTIKVNITDKANFDNETKRSRDAKDDSGIDALFGLKKVPLTKTPIPGRLLTADSSTSTEGKGSVNRSEALKTSVAAVVTQLLPNGNLVIEGKQEVRVNFELRELVVAGIVRPEDIENDNTLDSNKIAQARIAYGGRGQLTDMQQPRWGQQITDVILPF